MLELKTVLREDHTALNVLDRALKQDQCNSEEVALTVKNIAKYLPDKHHDNINKVIIWVLVSRIMPLSVFAKPGV